MRESEKEERTTSRVPTAHHREGDDGINTTILVGSDGSAPSRSALKWAVQRAAARDMSVLLCHVLDVGQDGPFAVEASTETAALGYLRTEAALAGSVWPQVDIRCLVQVGRPVPVLTGLSRDADLLVVGTHKTGFIQGRAYGSRFAGLVSSIDIPVAFIPDHAGSYRNGIVAGIDRSSSGLSVTRFAAAEAARSNDTLTLIGARDIVQARPDRMTLPPGPRSHAEVEASLQRAAQYAAREYPLLTVRTRNLGGRFAEALIDAASRSRLLVIGHATDSSRAATVHDVLLNLSSPTIVVHPTPEISSSPHEVLERTIRHDLDDSDDIREARPAGR